MALNLFQKLVQKNPIDSGCITSDILSSLEVIGDHCFYVLSDDFFPIKVSNVAFNNNLRELKYISVSPEFTQSIVIGENVTKIANFTMMLSGYVSGTDYTITFNYYATNAEDNNVVGAIAVPCFTGQNKSNSQQQVNLTVNINIKSTVRTLPNNAFYSLNGGSIFVTSTCNINIEEGLTTLGDNAFPVTDLIFPSTLITIKGAIDRGNVSGHTYTFKTPSGVAMTLPTAGNGSGMFYNKTAKTMTIYTDNETIKNYNWSADNVTPTFYHLDGTAW